MKALSFGVLIFNAAGQLLMAHVTGQRHWDIPKGGAEAGESPREAALRELQEETGIVLNADALASLQELGRMPYSQTKDLHLFRVMLPAQDCDLSGCRCTSFFAHQRTGVMTPEVDAFRWVDAAEVPKLAAKSMTALLRKLPGFEAIAG